MKHVLTIVFCYGSILMVSAQPKKHSTVNDVDRLYEKYKNADSMLITNVNGSFYTHITIRFNSEGKPEAITLSGSCSSIDAVKSFIDDLKNDRLAKGYSLESSSSGTTYTKDSLYTRINTFETDYAMIQEYHLKGPPEITFSIEDGDVKRIAGSKAKAIDF